MKFTPSAAAPSLTTLPTCLRQATVSRSRACALVAAKPAGPPLRSSRLDRSACVSSSHASASHLRGSPISARTMGHSQVRRRSKPHRGFDKKALFRPYTGEANIAGLPKKILRSKRFFGKRRSRHQSLAPTKEGRARFALLRRGGKEIMIALPRYGKQGK